MKSKCLIALLLMVLIGNVVMPFQVYAQTATAPTVGDGTVGSPYQIATWENLYWISQNSGEWDKHYIQTRDVYLPSSVSTWDGNTGWTPIGNSGTNFTGSYNGDGHRIDGLYIWRPAVDNQGLFGKTSPSATISNLGVTRLLVGGSSYVGGLVGYNNGGTIDNCYATGKPYENSIQATFGVGGLVGFNDNNGGIYNSSASIKIVATSNNVGGLVGDNRGTVYSCYSTGAVNGAVNVGGLVGENWGSVNRCYATGRVEGTGNRVGGLIGMQHDGGVQDSYATGTAVGVGYLGGLVGWNYSNTGTSTVLRCYAAVEVVGAGDYRGGLVGMNGGTIDASYQNVTICTLWPTGGGNGGGAQLTTAQMQNSANFGGWDFAGESSVWKMSSTKTFNGYPTLTWAKGYAEEPVNVGGVYQVEKLTNLVWMMDSTNRWSFSYKQSADINAYPTYGWNGNYGWTPVGNFDVTNFTGNYSGDGHTINGLFMKTNAEYQALFGVTHADATISNLGLTDVRISADGNNASGSAGIAGRNIGTISNSFVTGYVGTASMSNYVGAIAGVNGGTITNCYSTTGLVTGAWWVGGLVGQNIEGGTISKCYSAINVSSPEWGTGGLVGYFTGTISNSFWNTDIIATGVIGDSGGGATGLNTAGMHTQSNFTDAEWNFADTWLILSDLNNAYPILRAFAGHIAPTEITSFDAITDLAAGTAGSATYANAAAVIAALPVSVTANNNTVTVPVTTWVDTDSYNPNVAGSYTFTATLGAIPDGYANAGNHIATVDVAVAAAPTEITGFDDITDVAAGTSGSATYANAAAVIAVLSTNVTANNNTVTVPVTTWVDTDSYNPNVAGSYTFTATLGAIPDGYANAGNHTATVKVVVAAAPTEITGFDDITDVAAGTSGSATYANAAAVIAVLSTNVTANNNTVTVPVTTWVDTDSYNPNVAGSYTFTATLGAIPDGYANAGNHTAAVEVVVGTVSTNANLSGLVLSTGTLSPEFASDATAYSASVAYGVSSITLTPTKEEANASISVNGSAVVSGQVSDTVALSVGVNTITVIVTAQDGTTKTYTVIVSRAPESNSGSSDESGSSEESSSSSTLDNKDSVVVIVNGKTENAGTETKTTESGKTTVTIQVNNTVLDRKIDEAIKSNTTGQENVIQILVADMKSDVAVVELTGDIVKKLEENNFDVSVKRDNIEYIIPAEEFTISKVAENLGVLEKDLKDIKIEVQITKLDEKVVEKYNEVAKANGAELLFPPIAFEVVAKTTKADGTIGEVEISKFSNYVERVMEIPSGVDSSKITTGIIFNPDGSYSHVPTEVYQKDGKWYAKLNSLTNSNYSVVWNPVIVKSVENHWSKDAVNDLASRLVIFNPETFDPNKAITRADFAEYIVRALGLYRVGSTHENKFSDVSEAGHRTLAILIANDYGVVTGYPDGTFRPDQQITREEAMAMYQRAMKITKLVGTDNNRYQSYTDYKEVGSWATSYVQAVLSAHVFNGTTAATISPKANLTYAEAAQAIKNLLVESKLINQ